MVNDQTTDVLKKYDVEVLRLWKGRGAFFCETKTGTKVLKEYKGSPAKLELQNEILCYIKQNGYKQAEEIRRSKEGELVVKADEFTSYYLKDYGEGKECNIRETRDCLKAAEAMANLHKAMEIKDTAGKEEVPIADVVAEVEKQNRELKKIKKYLKEKKQKTEFEYYLQMNFDVFLDKAQETLEKMKERHEIFDIHTIRKEGIFCHGDMQHHNLLLSDGGEYFINFEKCILDTPVRDLCLFFRKMMEKNNWSWEMGKHVLETYDKNRKLSVREREQMYYRLSYPEKFRKIANFYYNSPKTMIPGKNHEKLEKILKQEEQRLKVLEEARKFFIA